MQRTEQEITSRSHINLIIQKSTICRLAFCQNNRPYLVPLSFGYDGEKIYFHTSQEGMKIDYLRQNNQVCFELEYEVKILENAQKACGWSVSFFSVIGFGKVSEIFIDDEKVNALNHIMRHYSNRTWRFEKKSIDSCRLWMIEIISMTGKKSVDKDISSILE